VKSIARGISATDARHFARTSHDGLPEKVDRDKQGGHSVKTLEHTPAQKAAAFIRGLANRIPTSEKAAEALGNLQKVSKLQKLAAAVEQHGNLPDAVAEVYTGTTPAYRQQVMSGIIAGMGCRF
jgi:hypothetical protein